MSAALAGSSIVGIVMLVLGGLMYWKKKSVKVVTWLWVCAGFTLAGSVVTGLKDLMKEAAKAGTGPTGLTVSAIVGILGCAAFWLVWHDVPLRRGKGIAAGRGGDLGSKSSGKRYTPFLGLLAPMLTLSCTGLLGVWSGNTAALLGRLSGPLATFFGA